MSCLFVCMVWFWVIAGIVWALGKAVNWLLF